MQHFHQIKTLFNAPYPLPTQLYNCDLIYTWSMKPFIFCLLDLEAKAVMKLAKCLVDCTWEKNTVSSCNKKVAMWHDCSNRKSKRGMSCVIHRRSLESVDAWPQRYKENKTSCTMIICHYYSLNLVLCKTKQYSQLLHVAVYCMLINTKRTSIRAKWWWEIQMEAGGGPACINRLRSQAYFLMNFNVVIFFQ